MRIGDRVSLFSDSGFQGFLTIVEVGVSSGLGDGLTCYKMNDGTLFYMRPEIRTGRHFNVGNKAFWIVASDNF